MLTSTVIIVNIRQVEKVCLVGNFEISRGAEKVLLLAKTWTRRASINMQIANDCSQTMHVDKHWFQSLMWEVKRWTYYEVRRAVYICCLYLLQRSMTLSKISGIYKSVLLLVAFYSICVSIKVFEHSN